MTGHRWQMEEGSGTGISTRFPESVQTDVLCFSRVKCVGILRWPPPPPPQPHKGTKGIRDGNHLLQVCTTSKGYRSIYHWTLKEDPAKQKGPQKLMFPICSNPEQGDKREPDQGRILVCAKSETRSNVMRFAYEPWHSPATVEEDSTWKHLKFLQKNGNLISNCGRNYGYLLFSRHIECFPQEYISFLQNIKCFHQFRKTILKKNAK